MLTHFLSSAHEKEKKKIEGKKEFKQKRGAPKVSGTGRKYKMLLRGYYICYY